MYKELDIAKSLHDNGFTNGYRMGEAIKVAKYMRHILGYGDARTKTELIKFCVKNDKLFRPVPNRSGIIKAVNGSKRGFTDTTDTVIITKNEINSIQQVKNFKYQKIMLAILLVCKIKNKNSFWLNERPSIRKIVSRKISNDDIATCLTMYYGVEMVEVIGRRHTLLFIDEYTDKPSIIIDSDYAVHNLVSYYETVCGGEISYCKSCEKEIKRTSNRRAYCDHCGRDRELQRKREWKSNR